MHFLLLGALLFGVQRYWTSTADPAPRPTPIVLTGGDIERWRREWPQQYGVMATGAPTDAEIIEAAIDEAVLLREAFAREFDRRDPVVRERLIQLGRYLGLASGGSDEVIEREARALGLQRSDEVVRRHLVEMMRLAAAKPVPADLPDDAALQAYYAANAARYAQPERIGFSHVYLSAERRGDRLDADARALLAELRRSAADPAAAPARGDPFARAAAVPLASLADIDRAFGTGFADALAELPERTWSGPIRSAYGLHLVWIDARAAAAVPPIEAVRSRVLHQYLDEHSQARMRERLRTWRARYDVRVER